MTDKCVLCGAAVTSDAVCETCKAACLHFSGKGLRLGYFHDNPSVSVDYLNRVGEVEKLLAENEQLRIRLKQCRDKAWEVYEATQLEEPHQ